VVTSLAFSPGGEILATGSGGVRPDDTIFGEVRLWDAETGQWLQTLSGHEGLVKSIAFSNDGRMLATGANDGRVKLWVTSSVVDPRARWRERLTLPRPPTRYRPVQSVAFSSEGLTLTVLHTDWAVFRYETQSGSSVQGTLSGPNTGVLLSSAAISPDGTLVAVGTETPPFGISAGRSNGTGSTRGYGQVRLVRLWNPGLSLYRTLRGHSDSVTAMSFSPDGTLLATGSRDNTVSLWDMQSVTGERRLGAHEGRVTSITFSADGTMLATGSEDTTIRLWDVQSEPMQP
jgi:WD40 repeat protein